MAKYGYRCKCGEFNLGRGKLTRKQYAAEKVAHAKNCELLDKELMQSAQANAVKTKN